MSRTKPPNATLALLGSALLGLVFVAGCSSSPSSSPTSSAPASADLTLSSPSVPSSSAPAGTAPSDPASSSSPPASASATPAPVTPEPDASAEFDADALKSQTLPVALKVLEFAVVGSRVSRGLDPSDPDPAVYKSLRKSAEVWISAARKAQKDLPAPAQEVLLDGIELTSIRVSDLSPRDGVTVAVANADAVCSITAVPLPKAAAWAWEGPECTSAAATP